MTHSEDRKLFSKDRIPPPVVVLKKSAKSRLSGARREQKLLKSLLIHRLVFGVHGGHVFVVAALESKSSGGGGVGRGL